MFNSTTDLDIRTVRPFVRKRLVGTQLWAFFYAWLLFAMAFSHPLSLEPITAVSILGASLASGLCLGFFLARRISSKANATGVYRRRAPNVAVVIVGCIAIVLFVPIGLLLVFGPSWLQNTAGLWVWTLTFGGTAIAAPLGTLLFERRARSRFWILWIPSLWAPEWIEYHLEYRPRL